MELMQWIGLCALCLLPMQLLRRKTPELELLLAAALVVLTAGRVLGQIAPLLEKMRELFSSAGVEGGHVDILLKTVAAATVTRLGAELCRDGGAQAVAAGVELAGTAVALTISLPLVEEAAELLLRLWGG